MDYEDNEYCKSQLPDSWGSIYPKKRSGAEQSFHLYGIDHIKPRQIKRGHLFRFASLFGIRFLIIFTVTYHLFHVCLRPLCKLLNQGEEGFPDLG